jgi:hypothetical protein
MSRELELQLHALDRRLERAESDIEHLRNPPPKRWLTPQEVEEFTEGKYRIRQIKRLIEEAIAHPADSPLKLNTHFMVDVTDRYRYYTVNLIEFDRAMVERAREELS